MTSPDPVPGVRVTLHPDEDLLLRPGARLGDLRGALAALLRRPELAHQPLEADGVPVGDDAVVGLPPLLPGATLAVSGAGCGRVEYGVAGGVARLLMPPVPRDRLGGIALVAAVLPAAGSLGLAAALHQPALALLALVGLVAVVPQVLAARRRSLASRHHSGSGAGTGDGAGAGIGVGEWAGGFRRSRRGRTRPRGPDALMAFAVALHDAPEGAWAAACSAWHDLGGAGGSEGMPGRHLASWPAGGARWLPARLADALVADGSLVINGPAEKARSLARAVVAGLAVRGARVDVAGESIATWEWCRWLPQRAGPRVLVVDDPATPTALAAAADAARAGALVLLCLTTGPGLPRLGGGSGGGGPGVVRSIAGGSGGGPGAGGPGAAGPPVPAWCRAVARVAGDGRVEVRRADGPRLRGRSAGVDAVWAERLGRRLVRAAWVGRSATALVGVGDVRSRGLAPPGGPGSVEEPDPEDPRLPASVSLAALHGLDTPPTAADSPGARSWPHWAPERRATELAERTTTRWAAGSGWAVPLGVGTDGAPVSIDLVADGPHLLVAGTTGSGKSELLQSLILGLALGRSPADLALVLVDFKGGAGLGACGALPHVVGRVTDLEAGLAARALAGLSAELRRRKATLARHGVADVERLPAGVLPRLVVVIDEFRALADDVPDFVPGLLRVAAQGRSLGVHLVLATQRPAGAVGADLRANVTARLALRVVDATESRDVVGSPAAARIPVGLPGRALLQVGAGTPVVLQAACAAVPPRPVPPAVRRAPAWPGHGTGHRPGQGRGAAAPGGKAVSPPGLLRGHVTDGAADPVQQIVDGLRSAAKAADLRPGPAPWLAPLPERVMADDPAVTALATGAARTVRTFPPEATGAASGSVPLALGDLPDEQRRAVVAWNPADGHLAVVGRVRSGRTTALVTLAAEALRRGLRVHALVPARSAGRFGALRAHPGFGTLAGPHDTAAVTALLRSHALGSPTDGSLTDRLTDEPPRTLVVVDGVETLRAALPPALPGQDPLWAALTEGAAFALSADGPSVGGLTARVGPRLVLLGNDRHADAALGAPARFAGAGGPPGRAVWLGPGDPVLCQVFVPG
ncbi:hypothetical protein L1785_03800 [Antribacter sp. KLBMP9083]|uniref:FtsK domain-containing protein n=1 Tax=Antribacter soli TaxID=2910976 RepID=A0AA41QAY1_9MICO|nr:FtsK/SpoIIIE domain-containing protein [Antribacter soli]MCF4120094.1 hypothetical protein [Antribacter soli]